MKRLSVLVPVILLALISMAWGKPPDRRGEDTMRDRLVTLRNWRLMQEFDLSGERAEKVFSILKKYDDKRQGLIVKRRGLLRKLRKKTGNQGASPKGIKELIRDLIQTNVALARLPEKEIKGLAGVFTTMEQARYILFMERFGREMQRIVRMGDRDSGRKRPGR